LEKKLENEANEKHKAEEKFQAEKLAKENEQA